MKKTIYIILTLIIIAGGYYFYDKNRNQVKAPVMEEGDLQSQNNNLPTPTPTPSPTAKPSTQTNVKGGSGVDFAPGTFSSGDENTDGGSGVQVVEVTYDGKAFSPSPININVNDWVFFKNTSSTDMWVASNPHETHSDYPGFDSKTKTAPGKIYKFQFTKAGTFGYHNNLNPEQGGSVVVK